MNENIYVDRELYLEEVMGLVITDMDGIVRFVNRECAEYFGAPVEELIGRKIGEDFFPETKMLENMNITKRKIVYYSTEYGIGISVNVPLYKDGRRIGLMEYDLVHDSKDLYEFSGAFTNFIENEQKELTKDIANIRSMKYSMSSIIGHSLPIMELKESIMLAAKSDSTVIITGETGTGKELVANAIHSISKRRRQRMVNINSSAIPESLAESEFFGYEEGAFTGAIKAGKIGKFEQADKGTLFIDEVGTMSLSIQSKLLRVLQEHEIDRVGGTRSIPVDIRIIAATNEPLGELVRQGRFREDLYYRLNVIQIETPPLRYHTSDIEMLVKSKILELDSLFGYSIKGIDDEALRLLKRYKWPGNVRELNNVVERAVNVAKGETLTVDDFNTTNLSNISPDGYVKEGTNLLAQARDRAEIQMISDALKKFGGNKTRAAEFLGISRTMLYQKMKRLNV